MEYTIEPTDVEVKLGIDDLQPNETDIAYRRGYQEGRISAKDLYEACKEQHNAIDILFAMLIKRDPNFFPSKSGKPWEAIIEGNKAVAKAEGK